MTKLPLLTLMFCAATVTVAAHADTFQFNYAGAGFMASGTFTGTLTNSPGVYQISDVSGTRNGVAIDGLDPGLDYADDLLYYPPTNTGTPQPASYLDASGIAYLAGGTSYNIYSSTTAPTLAENDDSTPITSFSVAPVSVTPEPSSLVLLGSGLLLGAGAIRRRILA